MAGTAPTVKASSLNEVSEPLDCSLNVVPSTLLRSNTLLNRPLLLLVSVRELLPQLRMALSMPLPQSPKSSDVRLTCWLKVSVRYSPPEMALLSRKELVTPRPPSPCAVGRAPRRRESRERPA